MQQMTTRPVLIVLIDGFADWETPLISAIGGSFYGLQVRHATPGGGQVRSMAGLQVTGLPDAVPQGDEVIVICGSNGWTGADAPDLSAMLRAAHSAGQTVAGICGGTLPLARAGLLNGRAHTSNGLDFLRQCLPDYSAQDNYRDQPAAVADDRIITAPGTAPVTFATEVLRAAGVPEPALEQFMALATAEVRR
ncbi:MULTISPECIES: DJ-1/PfpI family protein [unclassified Paracoccus (in: a-proteobacteria)]|uniref:DJ-1/PfpI family protein n=1 Tax=unclassified Paracoccus (in: a-proteobacteria) TaxID=2688777 RepID=UPI0012B2B4B1|nr:MULTISPECIES: DJ-1/PfpI family protein [unclassified Paracoccus (in: a-proteobacteria)]UXU75297.1 DJ-1/PfpI family protein [Paracoccus sp. SMMA_5]UXU81199.1 DJ-1/PfpI family protein [Paracoccus sp. SMMA_5_TC]